MKVRVLMNSDLSISYRYDDLCLEIVHEGQAGNLALLQATLLQTAETWRDMVNQAMLIEAQNAEQEEVISEIEDEELENEFGEEE